MKALALVTLILFATVLAGASGKPEELGPGLYAEFSTSRGNMVFELDYRNTPLTTAAFAGLAKGVLGNAGTPHFDGMEVDKTVRGYAVFIGQKKAAKNLGQSQTLSREINRELSAGDSGILLMDGMSMEISKNRYFITLSGDSFLDTTYTSFGRIVSGQNILKKLRPGDIIESVEILQIGEETQSLELNQTVFQNLISSGRKAELERLASMNPELAAAIGDLGDDYKKSASGIYYSLIKEGSGDFPQTGKQVSVHYTGFMLDGTVFDSSETRGQTFDIIIGEDRIIPGWIEIISGMRMGERRRVIIPPEMAYGDQTYGPIQPNSWLIFEMEMVNIADL